MLFTRRSFIRTLTAAGAGLAHAQQPREAKYNGALCIEGKWTEAQLAPAFAEIAKQAAEA